MVKIVTKISKVDSLKDVASIEEIEKSQFSLLLPQGTFTNAIEDDLSVFIKLEVDGVLASYLLASTNIYETEVVEIATHPDYLRKGYAELLMIELERIVKDKEYILLEVRKSNLSAIDLYDKLGYEKYHVRENYYRDHEDAVLMRKKLTK